VWTELNVWMFISFFVKKESRIVNWSWVIVYKDSIGNLFILIWWRSFTASIELTIGVLQLNIWLSQPNCSGILILKQFCTEVEEYWYGSSSVRVLEMLTGLGLGKWKLVLFIYTVPISWCDDTITTLFRHHIDYSLNN